MKIAIALIVLIVVIVAIGSTQTIKHAKQDVWLREEVVKPTPRVVVIETPRRKYDRLSRYAVGKGLSKQAAFHAYLHSLKK